MSMLYRPITLKVNRWVCIGCVSGVVFTKYQSSTVFHFSISVTGLGSPYGCALRFSRQVGVFGVTSLSVIIRGATGPPLSFGGPRPVSAATAGFTGSDPGPGTVIGAPLDAVVFTVICMTLVSDGAGVDTTEFGGLLFFISSVWPANPRKSQITSYRSAGVITSPFEPIGFTGSSPPSVPTMVIGTVALSFGVEIRRFTIRALQPFSTRNRYTAGSRVSFGQILPLTSITSPKYSPIHGPFVEAGATGYSSDPSALNCRSCTTIGSSYTPIGPGSSGLVPVSKESRIRYPPASPATTFIRVS